MRRGPDAQHTALRPPLDFEDADDEAETDAEEAESARSVVAGDRAGSVARSRKLSLASHSARLVAREPWLVRCLESAWHERPEARPDLRSLRAQLKPLLDGLYYISPPPFNFFIV